MDNMHADKGFNAGFNEYSVWVTRNNDNNIVNP